MTLSIICLGVDICAIYFTAENSQIFLGRLKVNISGHEAMMWTAESVLFIAVLVLLAFAFSKRPDRPNVV